jgi:hypothetical protein
MNSESDINSENENELDLFDITGLNFLLNNPIDMVDNDELLEQPNNSTTVKPIDSINFNKYVPINFGLPNANLNWRLSKFLDVNILNRMHLTEPQIDCLADILDWDIISNLELSGYMFVKHKDRINWEIFLQNDHPKEINFLVDVQDKLIEHQYLFFNPRMKRKYYNTPFILVFYNLIDWRWLVKNVKLDEYILLKFWEKFKPNDISRYQTITATIAKQKINRINWRIAGKRPLDEEVIHIANDYLDWETICKRQKNMSEATLIKFIHKLHWKNVSKYQKLSDAFIRKYRKKLDMHLVSQYQNLSIDLIKELEPFIDFELLIKNKNYNKPNTIQVFTNGKKYFIIEPPFIGDIPNINYLSINATF